MADGRMPVTAYSLPGITASGAPVGPGVAACPRWLAFGTQVQIEGVGVVTCADRYPASSGDHFDVWVATPAEVRTVTAWRNWALAPADPDTQ